MRIFVYEHLCATGAVGLPASLAAEGAAMLSAVVADLAALPDVRPVTILDDRVNVQLPGDVVSTRDEDGEHAAFEALTRSAAWTLVIAPEFDGILADRCDIVERAGGRLLGPSAAETRLAGDKLATSAALRSAGVPTSTTTLLGDGLPAGPCIIKPRDGAGSQATYFIADGGSPTARLVVEAARATWPGALIVQPLVAGTAVSVLVLGGPRGPLALPAATQRLSDDGRFHYLGGRLPLPDELATRATRLATAAARAVCPDSRGPLGVDIVLGGPGDGSGDVVIEVNPRLTTSYVGLRRLALANLAGVMLAVAAGAWPPGRPITWRAAGVEFHPDGRTKLLPG